MNDLKKLTIEQARRELSELITQRLTDSPPDKFLKTRIAQYMDAIEQAISDLQRQVAQPGQTRRT